LAREREKDITADRKRKRGEDQRLRGNREKRGKDLTCRRVTNKTINPSTP